LVTDTFCVLTSVISGAAALACSPVSHTLNHISNSHLSTNLRSVSLLNPDLLPLYSSLHHPTSRGSDNPRGPIITRDKTTAWKTWAWMGV